ncbi:uncharacterized protein ARB_01409 [Trichophyton benhamiae CBS 112371]|uniref:Uncharacterized protein n=1 Tax=Arthroderma benhamiae (strain ATCC MYA-4681 / CBS 112371) TaxID=663331 RepID=D4AYZ0_ARTBC|nr:uncharacterized protein ARB_01409 [Trichophyton benhamiae CBS 112371]EFE31810.1 hypothetical protein ARB_01409 [Trichophyton benhamiae CBS 112371]
MTVRDSTICTCPGAAELLFFSSSLALSLPLLTPLTLRLLLLLLLLLLTDSVTLVSLARRLVSSSSSSASLLSYYDSETG